MDKRIISVNSKAQKYNINIGNGLLAVAGKILSADILPSKVCIIVDEEVAKTYLVDLIKSLEPSGFNICPPIIISANQNFKDLNELQSVINTSLSYGLDKNSIFLGFGGGLISDLTAFAASMVFGGLGYAQIPTTLLSQASCSVVDKNRLNVAGATGVLASNNAPKSVIIDIDVLKTLPKREIKSSYAEMIKYASIVDVEFFNWLNENSESLITYDAKKMEEAVERSCLSKLKVIERDSELLALGREFSDAIANTKNYNNGCLYGELLGIGMALAYEFSAEKGFCSKGDVEIIYDIFSKYGLMVAPPFRVTANDIIESIKFYNRDKNGNIGLVLTRGLGDSFVSYDIDEAEIEEFLKNKFGWLTLKVKEDK